MDQESGADGKRSSEQVEKFNLKEGNSCGNIVFKNNNNNNKKTTKNKFGRHGGSRL